LIEKKKSDDKFEYAKIQIIHLDASKNRFSSRKMKKTKILKKNKQKITAKVALG
jgi:hypothetical protein